MADEREGQELKGGGASNRDKLQTEGRRENAAQPLDAAKDHGGAERYPETRSFAPGADAPEDDSSVDPQSSASPNEGRLGAAADPAEGKR
jgi:hypothetical protein